MGEGQAAVDTSGPLSRYSGGGLGRGSAVLGDRQTPSLAFPREYTGEGTGFWLLIALLALVAAGKVIQADTLDPDAFWHLRVADQLRRDGVGPLVDSLSYASLKTPWTPYSWLAELAMRGVWSFGFQAATAMTAACSAGLVVLIAVAARTAARPNALGVAVLTAVGGFFTLPFVSFRPVTLALLLLSAIVALLVRDRRRPTPWVWAVVPLTAVLANVHLYVVIVPVLVGLDAIGRLVPSPVYPRERVRVRALRATSAPAGRNALTLTLSRQYRERGPERDAPNDSGERSHRRRLALAVLVTLAACCTPMLSGVLATALHYQAVDPMVAANFITEMRPFYSGGTGKVALALFVALTATCLVRRRTLDATDWLWLAFSTVLLFRLGRFSPVFAVVATPAFAKACPPLAGRALGRGVIHAVLMVVLLAGLANVLPTLAGRDFDRWLNRNAPSYPTDAARFVAANVSARTGRLVNEFNWGGYLAWRLGDRWQVLMDGRTQLYAPAFWNQTHLGTPATRTALLRTITADAAVLPADGSCFAGPLQTLGWREAYRDGLAVVMVPPK